ncbi:MAG TPA: NAD(P)H-hydrate dehydratase [Pyrinomonadaceae bacterium]|nr:NAD(P)H-hydrate dehydratase [Pyrinomonadaceae bacterium]
MLKVLTAAQMREVDRLTTERCGIPPIILMENAAHAVACAITEKLGGSLSGKSVLILCGKGNNGGDGFALSRVLWNRGASVTVCFMFPDEEISGDAKLNLHLIRNLHSAQTGRDHPAICLAEFGTLRTFFDRLDPFMGPDVVVDAIFGTGLVRPLGGDLSLFARQFNSCFVTTDRPVFVSIDIPSGLSSDDPEPIGEHFRADLTVGFTAPKPANILPPASNFNGELIVANIGSPQTLIDEQPSQLYLAEREDAAAWLKKSEFSSDSYKNKRGHCLLVAGSEDYSGAAVLAANAAVRSGVGLVTAATPHGVKDPVASRVLPEVMVRGVAETVGKAISEDAFDEIQDLLDKADAVAVGCGLSQSESTKRFIEKLIENRRQPVVVDADALNLISPLASFASISESGPPLILTPHEGEFLRLLGTNEKDAIKDRAAAVREFAEKHNVILVLKDERALIAEPGGKVVVNPTGNSGLGKAGNGDTLAGIVAGFAAQAAKMNIDIFETVVAAVYISGMAGDIAEAKYGKRVMTASDVRECLTEAFAEFETS